MKVEQKGPRYSEQNQKVKTFYKYGLQETNIVSPYKRSKTQSDYTNFMEGFSTAQSFNELRAVSEVFSEKELARIGLFESVRKSKGEFHFKCLYQKSKYLEIRPSSDLSCWLNEKRYFVYIISGHFNLYKQTDYSLINNSEDAKLTEGFKKRNNEGNYNKCYIRSYMTHEHFGYQQYPLYWKEKLIFQASTYSQVLLFPLDTFYKVFSNVINLSSIQMTAEFLKKLPPFRQLEMEKLLRLSTFSQRIRIYPHTIIVKKQEKIDNIILLYDGRISVYNDFGEYFEERSGFLIGKKQTEFKSPTFQHQIKSIIQCDLIIIPLSEFAKVSQIKQKLKDSYFQDHERNVKSRKKIYSNLSIYQKQKRQPLKANTRLEESQHRNASVDALQPNKPKSFFLANSQIRTEKLNQYRPLTASLGLSVKRTGSKSVVYNENGRHFFLNQEASSPNGKGQSSMNLNNSEGKGSSERYKSHSIKKQDLENVTMGEIYWAKFMNRKNLVENKQIVQIINSRLPELILNEGKQFALVKPLAQKKSTYIKNYKRKIKNSHKISNLNSQEGDQKSQNIQFKVSSKQNRISYENFMINDEDI